MKIRWKLAFSLFLSLSLAQKHPNVQDNNTDLGYQVISKRFPKRNPKENQNIEDDWDFGASLKK